MTFQTIHFGSYPMSASYTLLLSFSIILALYFLSTLIKSYFRLSHIPGPTLNHFTSLPLGLTIFRGRADIFCDNLHNQYGPLVRIGPNSLLLSSFPELSRIQGARSSYTRSDWNTTIRMDCEQCQDSVTTLLDAREHASRKEKLKSGFSGSFKSSGSTGGGGGFDKVIDEQISTLLGLLGKYAAERKPVDFARTARFLVSDVTSAALMGKPLGWLENDREMYDIFTVNDALIRSVFAIGFVAPLRRLVFSWSFIKRFGNFSPQDEGGLGKFWGIVREEIKKREENSMEKRADMLTEWLAQGMTMQECELDAILTLGAGSDSTSTSMRATLLHLISSPTAYKRVKTEIKEATKNRTISNPARTSEARQLPYLQAVLHEGIRIMPSAVVVLPKCVPPEGDTICGFQVPGGTEIFQNHRAVMQDKDVFGDDIHVFRPERWLECSPEQKAQMTRHVDSLFGFGKWQCLGRTLAWAEMSKLFVELFRRFDFQVVNPAQPWKAHAYSTVSIDDFWVRVTEGG